MPTKPVTIKTRGSKVGNSGAVVAVTVATTGPKAVPTQPSLVRDVLPAMQPRERAVAHASCLRSAHCVNAAPAINQEWSCVLEVSHTDCELRSARRRRSIRYCMS